MKQMWPADATGSHEKKCDLTGVAVEVSPFSLAVLLSLSSWHNNAVSRATFCGLREPLRETHRTKRRNGTTAEKGSRATQGARSKTKNEGARLLELIHRRRTTVDHVRFEQRPSLGLFFFPIRFAIG